MILAAIKKSFDALHERRIQLPWIGPNGERWELDIRPHDHSEYQAALEKSGVHPLNTNARRVDNSADLAGYDTAAEIIGSGGKISESALEGLKNRAAARSLAAKRAADEILEIVGTLDFPYDSYDPCYTLGEAAKMAPHVAEHLVVRGFVVLPDSSRSEIPEKDLKASFLSAALLPRVIEVKEGGETKEHVLYLGGKPYGAALSAIVLRESIKAHLFLERVVRPLESSSSSDPPDEDTSPSRPDSPGASSQASMPSSTAATPA